MAELDHVRRAAVLFIDGDGQHPSALVEQQLVSHWIVGGYDVAHTAKAHRDNGSLMRRLSVHSFYATINWGAQQKILEDAGDFRLPSLRTVASPRQLPELNRFFRRSASWIGFGQIPVDYEPVPRAHGVTTFSVMRLLGLSIEGLTLFSVTSLRIASLLGDDFGIGAAFLIGLSMIVDVWTTGKQVPGYASLVVGLMTLSRLQLIMIGTVGEFIGKILSELKARSIYFVTEHSGKQFEAEGCESKNLRTTAEIGSCQCT